MDTLLVLHARNHMPQDQHYGGIRNTNVERRPDLVVLCVNTRVSKRVM